MVAAAEKQLGGIDVLVNNAGLGLSAPVDEIDPKDLRYVFEVNVMAPHIGTLAALPGMLQRRRGRIVNVGSVASHISTRPWADTAPPSSPSRRSAMPSGWSSRVPAWG
jgi:NAD(P)-dependent dehydrogenase (short-subunit alcohol dehydrogenase family)